MRTIKINIDRDAVLLEVAQRAYTLGEVIADNEKVRWLLQSVTDAGHKEMMSRAMSDAMELIYQAMSPYKENRDNVRDGNAEIEEATTGVLLEKYVMLYVPDNSLADLPRRLARAVHGVLVESCMARWHELMKQDANVSLMRVSAGLGDIKVMLNTRIGVLTQID